MLNQCILNDGKRKREPAGFLGQQTHSTDKEAEVPLGTVLCYGPSPSPDPVGRPPHLAVPRPHHTPSGLHLLFLLILR